MLEWREVYALQIFYGFNKQKCLILVFMFMKILNDEEFVELNETGKMKIKCEFTIIMLS